MLLLILKWVHILCMIGAFGGLLLFQYGLPASLRASDEATRTAIRLLNILIGAGFTAGLAVYVFSRGNLLGPHYNGVIGMKFMILLVVGALVPMSRKPGKGGAFRTVALVLLAVAALAGLSL